MYLGAGGKRQIRVLAPINLIITFKYKTGVIGKCESKEKATGAILDQCLSVPLLYSNC